MVKYVLTGSIGAGKSTFVKMLKPLLPTFLFYDVDAFVANLYQDPSWQQNLNAVFGTYDKKTLSSLYFSDATVKKQIDELFTPPVENYLRMIAKAGASSITEYAVVHEYSHNKFFDKTIVVAATDEVRINRVMARNGHTREKVEKILAAQYPQSKKIEGAEYVVWNDSDQATLYQQALKLAQILV